MVKNKRRINRTSNSRIAPCMSDTDRVTKRLAKIEETKNEIITWHDVNTTKPDPETSVLCCRAEDFLFCHWNDYDNKFVSCETGCWISGVTHWADPKGPQ